jgi:hypothetical protein
VFKRGPQVKNGPINIVHIFCRNSPWCKRIPFQLRKWHVAGTQLRELIFEIEHGVLWEFLRRGYLKKSTRLILLKLSRIAPLTALNKMA